MPDHQWTQVGELAGDHMVVQLLPNPSCEETLTPALIMESNIEKMVLHLGWEEARRLHHTLGDMLFQHSESGLA